MATRWRRFGVYAVIGAVAIAALGVGVGRLTLGPRVDAYLPVEHPIQQTLLVTGRLVSEGRVDLGAQVQSTVVEVPVEEGQAVDAGTLLVRLADDEALARLAEAEAQAAEAEARLRRVRGVGQRVASERVTQAEVALADAEKRYERAETQLRAGAITEAAHDTARRDRDTARSQLVAARLEAAATGASGDDTAAAVAALARAMAVRDVALAGVDRTRLRAPADGIVLRRTVEVGQVVRPGDVLLELASRGPLEVRITPDEVHLGALAVGLDARVVVEAFPSRPLRARVAHIAPQIDAARGTVEVRLDLADEFDEASLRPDMSATVEVLLGARERALVLPAWLVRDLGVGAPWVLVAEEGVARARAGVIGLVGDDLVEIREGLTADDAVIPPEAAAEPGDAVRMRPARPAPTEG